MRFALEAVGTALVLASGVVAAVLPERYLAEGGASSVEVAAAVFAAYTVIVVCAALLFQLHLNPILTFVELLAGRVASDHGPLLVGSQVCGATVGVVVSQALLNLDPIQETGLVPTSLDFAAIECAAGFVAAFLWLVFRKLYHTNRTRLALTAIAIAAVSCSIMALTADLTFANPAAVIARTLSAGWLGLSPTQAVVACLAQMSGATAAWIAFDASQAKA